MPSRSERSRPRLLVVVPTFNNEKTIRVAVEGAKVQGHHVLVVNDGSTDDTGSILREISDVTMIFHERNRGKGQALMTGFRFALGQGYSHVITMDADGQHHPSDIAVLSDAARKWPDHIIIGARRMEDADAGDVPGSARFGRKFSNFWVRVETGMTLEDTQSGYRVYPLNGLALDRLETTRYDFEIDILVRSCWRGTTVKEVPVQVYYPPRFERVSHFHPYLDNMRLSLLHTRLVTTKWAHLLWSLLRLTKQSRQEVIESTSRVSPPLVDGYVHQVDKGRTS